MNENDGGGATMTADVAVAAEGGDGMVGIEENGNGDSPFSPTISLTMVNMTSQGPRLHFAQYKSDYESQSGCDLTLTCSGAETIHCHAMVVAAAFPFIGDVLLDEEEAEENNLFLVDFSRNEVAGVINWIYSVLVNGGDGEDCSDLYMEQALAAALDAVPGVVADLKKVRQQKTKKKRRRKNSFCCSCGQQKPEGYLNNNVQIANGGGSDDEVTAVGTAKVKVEAEADPSFYMDDDEKFIDDDEYYPEYEESDFDVGGRGRSRALGWEDEDEEEEEEEEWDDVKPRRKRGRPRKSPGEPKASYKKKARVKREPKVKKERVKREAFENSEDDDYVPGAEKKYESDEAGTDDSDDDYGGGLSRLGSVLAKLPEDKHKTHNEVEGFDQEYPHSSINYLQQMLRESQGSLQHVNVAKKILAGRTSRFFDNSYFQVRKRQIYNHNKDRRING
jgi:hypothetical protein